MITCPNCLHEVDDVSKFCQFCGKKLDGVASQVSPPQENTLSPQTSPSPHFIPQTSPQGPSSKSSGQSTPQDSFFDPFQTSIQTPDNISRQATDPVRVSSSDYYQSSVQSSTMGLTYGSFQKPSQPVTAGPSKESSQHGSPSLSLLPQKKNNLVLFIGIGAVVIMVVVGSILGFLMLHDNNVEEDPVAQTAAVEATMNVLVITEQAKLQSGGQFELASTPAPGQEVATTEVAPTEGAPAEGPPAGGAPAGGAPTIE